MARPTIRLGTGAYQSARGEIRFRDAGPGTTLLQVATNGDRTADLAHGIRAWARGTQPAGGPFPNR